MRRRAPAIVFVALGVAAAFGCVSLHGLSGAPEEHPEAGTGDAQVTGDAGDAGDAAVSPETGSFCASLDASVCEDFDDSNLPTTFNGWAKSLAPGNELTRVDSGRSPPNALEVRIGASTQTDAGTSLVASLGSALPSANRVRVRYRLFIDTPDPGNAVLQLSSLAAVNGGAQLSLRLILSGGGVRVVAAASPSDGGSATFFNVTPIAGITGGEWHDVEIDLDLVALPARATVKLDGLALGDNVVIPDSSLGPSPLRFQIGAFYATAPTAGWVVRIDDYALFAE